MKQFFIRLCCVSALSSMFVWLVLHQLDYPKTGIDDANIFFVYAEHLIEGHGFVYNVGGERVEGFTSLLWVLIAAMAFSITDDPEFLLLLFNILLLSVTMTSVTLYIDHLFGWKKDKTRLNRISPYSVLYLALLFFSPDYITWMTVTIMDTGIWGALLVSTALVVLKIQPERPVKPLIYLLSALITLLLLTRPESIVWSPVFIGLVWLRFSLGSGWKKAGHTILPPLTAYGVTLLLLTIFRWVYFGYPLPNTYYAKISPIWIYNLSQGIVYFRKYFESSFIVQVSILCFLVLLYFSGVTIVQALLKKNLRVKGFHFLPAITLVGIFIPIMTGGDHFSLFRFYQPIYPLFILHILIAGKFLVGTRILQEQAPQIHPKIVLGIILLFLWGSQQKSWNQLGQFGNIKREFYVAERWKMMGKLLTEFWNNLDEYPSVGTILAGGIKRSYEGEVVDLMGLNNTRMAHSPGKRTGIKNHAAFEKKTFYEMQPDIILPCLLPNVTCIQDGRNLSKEVLANRWVKVSLKNIWEDTEFQKKYDLVQIIKNNGVQNQCLTGFISRRFLSTIGDNSIYTVQRFSYFGRDTAQP